MSRFTVTVKDVMNRNVVTVPADMTVSELAAFFVEKELWGAPVEGADGELIGVVSATDIVRFTSDDTFAGPGFYRQHPAPEPRLGGLDTKRLSAGPQVSDIMTPEIFCVDEGSTVSHAARYMRDAHLHRLLVVNDEKVVGIVSASDLLSVLIDDDEPVNVETSAEEA